MRIESKFKEMAFIKHTWEAKLTNMKQLENSLRKYYRCEYGEQKNGFPTITGN